MNISGVPTISAARPWSTKADKAPRQTSDKATEEGDRIVPPAVGKTLLRSRLEHHQADLTVHGRRGGQWCSEREHGIAVCRLRHTWGHFRAPCPSPCVVLTG